MQKFSQIKYTFTITKGVLEYDSGHTEGLWTADSM